MAGYLYHLVPASVWETLPPGPYRPASLAAEGFVHCSHPGQVTWVANQFYAEVPDLLVLTLDPGLLGGQVREEGPAGGPIFPHVYGPIEREAVVNVRPLAH